MNVDAVHSEFALVEFECFHGELFFEQKFFVFCFPQEVNGRRGRSPDPEGRGDVRRGRSRVRDRVGDHVEVGCIALVF